MDRFAIWIVNHRTALIVLVIFLTAWMGWEASTLQMDTDVLNFFPDSDPDVQYFKEVGGKFGSNYINMVAIETDDIFTTKTLESLARVTDALNSLSGVNNALSLTNVLDMKRIEGTLSVNTLIDAAHIPTDPAALAELKKYTLSNPTYVGNLVSKDARAALIAVRIEENANKEKVARAIKDTATKYGGDNRLYFGGFSMVMEYMGQMVTADMGRLIPITIVLLLLVLYLSFGSLRGVLLPMGVTLLSTLWTLGAMAFLGIPLSMLTSVIPVVIIAIGSASSIYMLVRYYEQGEITPEPKEAVCVALEIVSLPILIAGATTAFGFLALVAAPLELFKQFGIAAAIGSVFSTLLSVTLVPVILVMMPYRPMKKVLFKNSDSIGLENILLRFGKGVLAMKTAIIVLGVLLVVVAVVSIPHISRYVNLLTYFPEDSEPRLSEKILKEKFGGSQLFIVNFRGKSMRHPAVLMQMELLQKRLRVLPDVNYPQSIADILSNLNRMINDQYGLPDSTEKINNLYILIDGQSLIGQFIQPNFTNAVVQARIGDMDAKVVSQALALIHEAVDQVGTSLAAVDLPGLSGEARDVVTATAARRMAEKVLLDLKYYGVENAFSQDDLAALIVEIMRRDVEHDQKDKDRLCKLFLGYFSGEASDVHVGSDVQALALAAELCRIAQFSKEEIAGKLKANLPAQTLVDDPEAVDFTASALIALVRQYDQKKRVDETISQIFATLGQKAPESDMPLLFADLKSDLWEMNHDRLYVDQKLHTKILKNAKDAERIDFSVKLTGWPPISAKFDAQLVITQVKSLALALATILILLAMVMHSFTGGLVASIPVVFTILINFGVMSALGIPLDNTTMMISSIAMGIGVGYSIHFLARFRMELFIGRNFEEAYLVTLTTKGRAIIINTLAVALGFSVLVFSDMIPQKRFGLLVALTMFIGAFCSLTVLPMVLIKFKPGFISAFIGGKPNEPGEME